MEQILIRIQDLMPAIFFAVIGIIFIVVVIVRRYHKKKDREELEPIAAALGGKYVATKHASYISLPGFAPDARLEFDNRGDDLPSYLLLSMAAKTDFDLDITNQGRAIKVPPSDSRLEEDLSSDAVAVDFSPEEPELAIKYQVLSSNPGLAKSFLLSGSRRKTLDDLFNSGFAWIRVENGTAFLQKPQFQDSDLAPDKIRYYLEQLQKIAGA